MDRKAGWPAWTDGTSLMAMSALTMIFWVSATTQGTVSPVRSSPSTAFMDMTTPLMGETTVHCSMRWVSSFTVS